MKHKPYWQKHFTWMFFAGIIILGIAALFSGCTKPAPVQPVTNYYCIDSLSINGAKKIGLPSSIDSSVAYKDSLIVWVYGKSDTMTYSIRSKYYTINSYYMVSCDLIINGRNYDGYYDMATHYPPPPYSFLPSSGTDWGTQGTPIYTAQAINIYLNPTFLTRLSNTMALSQIYLKKANRTVN